MYKMQQTNIKYCAISSQTHLDQLLSVSRLGNLCSAPEVLVVEVFPFSVTPDSSKQVICSYNVI